MRRCRFGGQLRKVARSGAGLRLYRVALAGHRRVDSDVATRPDPAFSPFRAGRDRMAPVARLRYTPKHRLSDNDATLMRILFCVQPSQATALEARCAACERTAASIHREESDRRLRRADAGCSLDYHPDFRGHGHARAQGDPRSSRASCRPLQRTRRSLFAGDQRMARVQTSGSDGGEPASLGSASVLAASHAACASAGNASAHLW